MSDTSGFYKNDNGQLLYASSAVIGANAHLVKELKDTYEYPVDGWIWFNNEDDARTSLNIPIVVVPEPPQIPGMPLMPHPPMTPMFTLPTGPVTYR